jgi:hypothetical protein
VGKVRFGETVEVAESVSMPGDSGPTRMREAKPMSLHREAWGTQAGERRTYMLPTELALL